MAADGGEMLKSVYVSESESRVLNMRSTLLRLGNCRKEHIRIQEYVVNFERKKIKYNFREIPTIFL